MGFKKTFRIRIDNNEYLVTVERKDETFLEVILDGKSYNVRVEPQEETFSPSFSPPKTSELNSSLPGTSPLPPVDVANKYFTTKDIEKSPKISSLKLDTTKKLVFAPIPGKIIKIFANIGDFVRTGQILLQLEAMKMSNDIVSPCNGKIMKIAPIGLNVAYKDELIVIEANAVKDDANE